jgi:hypothetical protein
LELKSQTQKGDTYVLPPKSVVEKKMAWMGTLSIQTINVSGSKKEKLLILTTGDGKKVVFTKKSIVNFSLIGMDLGMNVGKEMSINGMASVRKTVAGKIYLVSKIATATRKDSAIYSDLME